MMVLKGFILLGLIIIGVIIVGFIALRVIQAIRAMKAGD